MVLWIKNAIRMACGSMLWPFLKQNCSGSIYSFMVYLFLRLVLKKLFSWPWRYSIAKLWVYGFLAVSSCFLVLEMLRWLRFSIALENVLIWDIYGLYSKVLFWSFVLHNSLPCLGFRRIILLSYYIFHLFTVSCSSVLVRFNGQHWFSTSLSFLLPTCIAIEVHHQDLYLACINTQYFLLVEVLVCVVSFCKPYVQFVLHSASFSSKISPCDSFLEVLLPHFSAL